MGAPDASRRSKRIAPFEVMDIVAAARRRDEAAAGSGGEPVLHLEVGQPSARPPGAVLEAARRGLEEPLGYTDALGTEELRRAIAEFYAERNDVAVAPERIAVTSGASAGCVLTFITLCDPGERVVVFEPGYPCYSNIAMALGLGVETVGLGADTGYVPRPPHLDAAVAGGGNVSAVVVASPSNPTGTALTEQELAALHDWCTTNGATLVVDEIYHGTATSTLPTAATYDDSVVLQSFSKYFCMTGWRLGWLVLPPQLVRSLEAVQQNLYLSPHALSQKAALGALGSTAELDEHATRYRANREVLVSALSSAGVETIAPAHGAFYVWADLSGWGPSPELCKLWLEDLGVAATPGGDFDSSHGASFVRFSVAGSHPEVAEAAQRLGAWLTERSGGSQR